jgi:DNA-binding response OmpR family regulator
MRVLVVEDETRLAASLRTGLQAEGFAVDVAPDGHGDDERTVRVTAYSPKAAFMSGADCPERSGATPSTWAMYRVSE